MMKTPKNLNWLQVTVSVCNKIMMHARATEFDGANLLAMLYIILLMIELLKLTYFDMHIVS